jgi:hypothetical protein
MDWCDSSVINWDAVGAVGTWVVGAGAVWVAVQANLVASRLKVAQQTRERAASRAMLLGLRLEAIEYARRLRILAQALHSEAESPGDGTANFVSLAFQSMSQAGFSDFAHRASHIGDLPSALADDVNWLYARERINRAKFVSNAAMFADIAAKWTKGPQHPRWKKSCASLPTTWSRRPSEWRASSNASVHTSGLTRQRRETAQPATPSRSDLAPLRQDCVSRPQLASVLIRF